VSPALGLKRSGSQGIDNRPMKLVEWRTTV